MDAAGCGVTGADRDDHRLRRRRLPGDGGGGAHHRAARPAPALAVHDPLVSRQSRRRPRLDQIRLQGRAGHAGHGVCRRRPGDRRCRAHDPRRRSRCRDLRRRGGLHRYRQPRRLCRSTRAVERLQRRARARLAPVRSRPRRFCHGRRRRHPGDRGARTCARARRHADRRDRRIWHDGGRLSHDVGPARWRRRPPRHGDRAAAGKPCARGSAASQRACDIDAGRRRERARRDRRAVRPQQIHRGQRDQIGHRPSARCRRRPGGDLHRPRLARPDRAADAQFRKPGSRR